MVVSGKSTEDDPSAPFPPDPNSPQSTINTVVREIHEASGTAAAVPVDVRDFESVQAMVTKTVELYGSIDALIYNAGAIWWSSVEKTPMRRFQLMQRVNPEGLYGTIQAAIPQFNKQGWKARVIVISPPIYSRFFRGKTAYAMGKVGMSVLVKGFAMDCEREKRKDFAISALWPGASITSGATRGADQGNLRKPEIFSDSIIEILRDDPSKVNGELFIDEDYLRDRHNVKDFSKYALVPGTSPRRIMPAELPNLRVAEHDDEGTRMDSTVSRSRALNDVSKL